MDLNREEKDIALAWLYRNFLDGIKATPDEVLIETISALRGVADRFAGRYASENLLAVRTMIADLETELDRRSKSMG